MISYRTNYKWNYNVSIFWLSSTHESLSNRKMRCKNAIELIFKDHIKQLVLEKTFKDFVTKGNIKIPVPKEHYLWILCNNWWY